MTNEEKIKISIECLMHAISDTQDTIRYYDIKSEIIGALLSAFVAIINVTMMNVSFLPVKCFLFLSLLFDFLAILSIGLVLYPRAVILKKINCGSYIAKNTYLMVNHVKTIPEQVDLVKETDWISELTFELSKLSLIRDRKRYFFKLVLLLSGASLFCYIIFYLFCFYLKLQPIV